MVQRATEQGFEVTLGGGTWSHPDWGIYNHPLPLPLKKEGGAPGVLDKAKEHGVKVVASIGGWSMCRHFPEVAADPVKRQRFVEDCVRLMNIGFDGIDLDWEYPGPFAGMNFTGTEADYENFAILAEEIRAAIGEDKLLTTCFAADINKISDFDWARLDRIFDYFNMMTYDYNGGWSNKAGHNSPLYTYDDAEAPTWNWNDLYNGLAALNVNLSKVNMGVPFYGRGVITNGPAGLNAPTLKRQDYVEPDGNIETCADFTNWRRDVYDGTPTYFYIKQTALGPNSGWTRHWDDQAKVPYMTKDNFFLSYDDENSIAYKAQFIVDKGLAGTIIWTAYGDLLFSGPYTAYGNKLKEWANVQSPLVDTINDVFAAGGPALPTPTPTPTPDPGTSPTPTPTPTPDPGTSPTPSPTPTLLNLGRNIRLGTVIRFM